MACYLVAFTDTSGSRRGIRDGDIQRGVNRALPMDSQGGAQAISTSVPANTESASSLYIENHSNTGSHSLTSAPLPASRCGLKETTTGANSTSPGGVVIHQGLKRVSDPMRSLSLPWAASFDRCARLMHNSFIKHFGTARSRFRLKGRSRILQSHR